MIDTRLFPLLETLAASNLDWLVRDILAVVEVGDRQVESEVALYDAHERIRLKEDLRSETKEQAEVAISKMWSGDEQVALAADLVVRRIKEALVMTRDSIEVVSTIIGEDTRADTTSLVEGVALVSDNGELQASTDRPAIKRALEGLEQLRLAVEEWKSEMLGGTETYDTRDI